MKRTAFLIYGTVSYLIFLGVFLYNAAFLANAIVPKTIDSGSASPPLQALPAYCRSLRPITPARPAPRSSAG